MASATGLDPATLAAAQLAQQKGAGGVSSDSFLVCYSPTMITTNGIWSGDNPLEYSLPLFILQTTLVVVVTRSVYVLIKPLRQPRFIAEVIGGVILGPSALGKIPNFLDVVFPTRSISILETMANLGLVYFIFLVGLQIDIGSVNRMGRRPWVVAAASVSLSFVIEILAFLAFGSDIRAKSYSDAYLLFLAASLSVTAFSVLARILAELKLLNTETGRIAMSAAIITDSLAWILLAIAIALTGKHRSGIASLGVISSGVAFIVATYCIARPAATWIVWRTREGEPIDNIYLCFIMLGVMACGVMADAFGIHAVFGAFAFGVAIPEGPLVVALIEKLEDFVTGILLPLFFAANGLRVKLESITNAGISGFLAGVILSAAAARVVMTMVVSTIFYGTPVREGLLLGILMNTKGLMEMVILRIALDKNVLYTQSYSIMVVMSVVLTTAVTPLATMVAQTGRRFINYKRRSIQRLKTDGELRVLACIHTARNVPSFVNLVEISNPTKKSPIFICAVHLMELTGRESAMLVVHDTRRTGGGVGKRRRRQNNLNRMQAQSEQIMAALESYEQHSAGVSVYPMTVVSAYSTMHDDIGRIAEDKRTALLILPFHKQQTVDGGMELANPGIRIVNQNIIADPPCSIAILVDKGLDGTARMAKAMGRHTAHHIAVLFFGGPDDREALAYAGRMAGHPAVNLTVLRFIDANINQQLVSEPSVAPARLKDSRVLNVMTEQERDRLIDDEFVKDFRVRSAGDETVAYVEKLVGNGEETVAVVRSMENMHDLYIVGRGEGMENPLMAGLTDWSECPELGPIGDLLASSDFATTVSVLVVQQYRGGPAMLPEGAESPRNADIVRGRLVSMTT